VAHCRTCKRVSVVCYVRSMKQSATTELLRRAEDWSRLHRWERAELGRALGWRFFDGDKFHLQVNVQKMAQACH